MERCWQKRRSERVGNNQRAPLSEEGRVSSLSLSFSFAAKLTWKRRLLPLAYATTAHLLIYSLVSTTLRCISSISLPCVPSRFVEEDREMCEMFRMGCGQNGTSINGKFGDEDSALSAPEISATKVLAKSIGFADSPHSSSSFAPLHSKYL